MIGLKGIHSTDNPVLKPSGEKGGIINGPSAMDEQRGHGAAAASWLGHPHTGRVQRALTQAVGVWDTLCLLPWLTHFN